jgi:betaine-aldehyde dehydrogenase
LPQHRDLFFGGSWQVPAGGYSRVLNPATQEDLGQAANANAEDVDKAVRAAQLGFLSWCRTKPAERSRLLRAFAEKVRAAAAELAYLDALNTGNPISEMRRDAHSAAAQIEYFAGLTLELKGDTLPVGEGALNYSVREPLGVIARLLAYNHPAMFLASKVAAPLAAGNSVVMKPPLQAPLSAYRLAEIARDVFPSGVVNIVSGGTETGQALVVHPLVRKATLIGSVGTGAAVLRAAADKIMPVGLELGGKNPMILCADVDVEQATRGAIAGMNFMWAGQSCGSTSRLFVHRSLYENVVARLAALVPALHRPGMPTDPATTMGCLISEAQFDKVMDLIASAKAQGARLVTGGRRPEDPALARGWFIEPTIFADVTPAMRLFHEEAFGPVLAVTPWDDEQQLFEMVNGVEMGLSASIWTRDLETAHRMAARVEAGFVWINHASAHYIGADFGGYKKSGLGREEGLSELLAYTQLKNVHLRYRP